MDLPVNRFKQSLRGATPPVGTWLMSAAPAAAEALGCAGLDFLVLDTEHVPLDVAQMIDMLRAIAGTPPRR
jgi:2-dehydro-3-deoxyglucarate aldolase/4-hydroxy-2-oxoheptanedioate aldolase